MTHFTIKGTASIRDVKPLRFNLLGSNFRKRAPIFYALMVLLLIIMFVADYKLLPVLLLFYLLIYTLRVFAAVRRAYRKNVQRSEELNRIVYDYECYIEDDFIRFNLSPGSSAEIKYTDIDRCIETKDCLFISTKADQLFQINKSDISADQLPALVAFLRGKGIKVPAKLLSKS